MCNSNNNNDDSCSGNMRIIYDDDTKYIISVLSVQIVYNDVRGTDSKYIGHNKPPNNTGWRV